MSCEPYTLIRQTLAAILLAAGAQASPAQQSNTAPASSDAVPAVRLAAAQNAPVPRSPAPAADDELAEIIVTATKRRERLLEVPGGISVQTAEQLQAIGAQDFKDYLTRVPGVAFNDGRANLSTVVIRGVGTSIDLGEGQGETGYFINEVPLSEPAYTISIPDVDTFDMERVEILRGPQGSLFGSASLGGAINYITKVADPGKLDMASEAGISTVKYGGGELGYTAKGMVNVPIIEDRLAARLAVSQRVEPGFINNPTVDERGTNDVHNFGARGSLVYAPGEATKLTYMGFYNHNVTDDISYSQLIYGPLEHRLLLQPQRFWTNIQSLRLDQDFGAVTFTGIAAYNGKRSDIQWDYTPNFEVFNPGHPHTFHQRGRSENWSFEARLASPVGERFDWIAGAMYMTTDKRFVENLGSPGFAEYDPGDVVRGDLYYEGIGRYEGSERAVFGEGNLHFGKLTLTAGGRLFKTELSVRTSNDGPVFFGPGVTLAGPFETTDDGFAPKVALKYQASPDAMVYALASKGFRFGTPNSIFQIPGLDIPRGTTTDSLWNYELGTKLDLLERRLLLDLTGFLIDWSNIQTRFNVPDSNLYYGDNAGKAKIRGVESSATLQLGGLRYIAGVTWLDAEIDETMDMLGGTIFKGQTLPGAADWRLANTLSYDFGGEMEPTVTLMHRYVSSSPAYLTDPTVFGGFNTFDARVSVKLGSFDLAAYVNNIDNKLGETFGNTDYGYGPLRFYIRPRTMGLQVNWKL